MPASKGAASGEFDRALGARVRATREARRVPLAVLAEQLAISPRGLSRLERGTRPATVPVLVALAKALDTSLAALLDGVHGLVAVRDHPLYDVLRESQRSATSWRQFQQALDDHLASR
jgi:transcriptional regulator with XRE-family HTH domain